MNRAGVLLDTGPLVALLSRRDVHHTRATKLFAACEPPLRTCEAVIAEAGFLLGTADPDAPSELFSLGRRGLYEIALSIDDHWAALETILRKYRQRGVSVADACLIQCAQIHDEPRILTFDSDFDVYRWARNKSFRVLSA